MKQIIVLIGISGSGKSTWTRDFISKNLNYIRINRDSIRECLVPDHKYTWYKSPNLKNSERLVTSICYDMIDTASLYDRDIILDNTNIKKKHLEDLLGYLKRHHSDYEVSIKIFECELKTAQNRVFRREWGNDAFEPEEYKDYFNQPEVEYIEKQYEQFQNNLEWIKSLPYKIET